MRHAAEMRAMQAEGKMKDLTDRFKAAETKAAQQEARASQAEARAKEAQSKATAGAGGDARVRMAEGKVAEMEQRLRAMEAIEQELRSMQGQEIQLKARIRELEDREEPTATNVVPVVAGGASSGEFEMLKTENANLKKKLMSAETAIEAAASLKAKVARLEAQLKGAPAKK